MQNSLLAGVAYEPRVERCVGEDFGAVLGYEDLLFELDALSGPALAGESFEGEDHVLLQDFIVVAEAAP